MIWAAQAVMEAVRALVCADGCVKHAAILAHTGLTNRQVANGCAKLELHGYLVRQKYADDIVKPGCYRLTKLGEAALAQGTKLTSGPKGPHVNRQLQTGTMRERAWNIFRIRGKASVPELVDQLLDAGSDDLIVKRAHNNLQKYLINLKRAGYLVEMRREAPTSLTSNGAKRYLLVRSTGPLAPAVQAKMNKVFDQNENKHYDIER
jgi:hypothetical protein